MTTSPNHKWKFLSPASLLSLVLFFSSPPSSPFLLLLLRIFNLFNFPDFAFPFSSYFYLASRPAWLFFSSASLFTRFSFCIAFRFGKNSAQIIFRRSLKRNTEFYITSDLQLVKPNVIKKCGATPTTTPIRNKIIINENIEHGKKRTHNPHR